MLCVSLKNDPYKAENARFRLSMFFNLVLCVALDGAILRGDTTSYWRNSEWKRSYGSISGPFTIPDPGHAMQTPPRTDREKRPDDVRVGGENDSSRKLAQIIARERLQTRRRATFRLRRFFCPSSRRRSNILLVFGAP